jgi:FkbM family methyltransferase
MNKITQIEVHNIGLAERPGVLQLNIPKADTLAYFAIAEDCEIQEVQSRIDVTVARGDDVVRDRIVGNLMLKADVEGFELYVLRGFEETIARYKPPILIEIVPSFFRRAGVDEIQLFDFFIERGYRGFEVSQTGRWKTLNFRLRPVKSLKELVGDEDLSTAIARNVLWLPISGGSFDPSAYFAAR